MPGRLSRSADFERALGRPACARSPHFAVHFVPAAGSHAADRALSTELSTASEQSSAQLVDDLSRDTGAALLGAVVPKRHARRSVTRSLIKRQIRAAASGHGMPACPPLPAGIWVVRLRAPFDRTQFVSAASAALRGAARDELRAMFEAARRCLGDEAGCRR